MQVAEMVDPFGAKAKAYIGFAWTVFLVGPLVPLFRGHLLGCLAMVATPLAVGYLISADGGEDSERYAALACLAVNLAFAFTYNSWHRAWLIARGYTPSSEPVPQLDKPSWAPETFIR